MLRIDEIPTPGFCNVHAALGAPAQGQDDR
jgi:hypothetical protein